MMGNRNDGEPFHRGPTVRIPEPLPHRELISSVATLRRTALKGGEVFGRASLRGSNTFLAGARAMRIILRMAITTCMVPVLTACSTPSAKAEAKERLSAKEMQELFTWFDK